ncbi:RNA-directed DNA polymerase, eukaryota, reverse transcriptase zinc-binding domain protein, partial [Tanacetum coccineum]
AEKACGSSKAPRPDGFNFKFLKKCWEIIKYDILKAVRRFWENERISRGSKILAERLKKVIDKLIGEVQSAFIKDRFILDGVLLVNEVMGFGRKWCGWIRECLETATSSILVNGTPTKEFVLQRGIRQGDPLSPFLFLIVVEGLNIMMQEVLNSDLFEVSELKVNLNKSKLYGIGIEMEEIEDYARSLECRAGKLPFLYLGLPIGINMGRIENWNIMVDKFKSKLADWKAKMISFGGRLTLVKSVLGSLSLYFFSLFRAPMSVLHSLESVQRDFFEEGGLGIQNIWFGLIGKRHWNSVSGEIIVKVGRDPCPASPTTIGINLALYTPIKWERLRMRKGIKGAWREDELGMGNALEDYLQEEGCLHCCPILQASTNLVHIWCWEGDVWKWKWNWVREPRGRAIGEVEALQNLLVQTSLSCDCRDTWRWALDDKGNFSVKELSRLIDDKWLLMDNTGQETSMFNLVLKKVSVFVWRALLGRILVSAELDKRGCDLDSLLCPHCDGGDNDNEEDVYLVALATGTTALPNQWRVAICPNAGDVS